MRSLTPRQWTGIALAVVALPALTATAWPLLAFLRGLLPDDLPIGRILLGAALTVVLVIAAVLIRAQRRTSFRLWWLILAAWAAAIGAVAGMVVLIWLVLGTPGLDLPTDLSPRALDAIATRAFAVVAGLGGVALLVIHYRRQLTTEAGEEREVSKLFTDTFDSASDKLGSEHAAIRLAGVHALARLADEAPEGREDLVQMVIDVLCAYLRMPYTPASDTLPKNASKAQRAEYHERELESVSFREVRHTVIRVIGSHLREPTRWRGKNYDFTGVVFDGGDLSGARFTGGVVSFHRAMFSGGEVDFSGAVFSGGVVNFGEAAFTRGVVSFHRAVFSGGEVSFGQAVFSGGDVDFSAAEVSAGKVSLTGARFSGGDVTFHWISFTGGRTSFFAAVFSGGNVSFGGAEFTRGEVSFRRAVFSGGEVGFAAVFSGGEVDFSGAVFSGGVVDFGESLKLCPQGLLEAVERGEPGIVALPEQWQPTTDQNGQQGDPSTPPDVPGH